MYRLDLARLRLVLGRLPFAGRRLHAALGFALLLTVVGCPSTGASNGPPGGEGLSDFHRDSLVVGRVVENATGCEVDVDCYLRIAFADTTVTGIYGTGERPAPACEIARGVSDLAFGLRPGDRIRVDLRPCGEEGWLYIATLGR